MCSIAATGSIVGGNIRVAGYELWVACCGLRVAGYELRDDDGAELQIQ